MSRVDSTVSAYSDERAYFSRYRVKQCSSLRLVFLFVLLHVDSLCVGAEYAVTSGGHV